MTGRPRSSVIDETTVGIYHVFTRCVRRAFLCGIDFPSGRDYSYRRGWITDRLKFLAASFAIDTCSFAVLSNHYHLLIRNRPDIVAEWSDREVAARWWRLTAEGKRRGDPTELDLQSLIDTEGWVAERRKRLASPSWFMKMVNEYISKRANGEEEDISGHFWQGRFGAVRLDTDLDVLAVSLYIDLNEIRAQLADCPENARYSSAFLRLGRLLQEEQALEQQQIAWAQQYTANDPDFWLSPIDETVTAPPLLTLEQLGLDAIEAEVIRSRPRPAGESGSNRAEPPPRAAPAGNPPMRRGFLTVDLKKYFELLEVVGRSLAPGRQGRIDPDLPPLLERLGINPSHWNVAAERAQGWLDALLTPLANQERRTRPGGAWQRFRCKVRLGSSEAEFNRRAAVRAASQRTTPTHFGPGTSQSPHPATSSQNSLGRCLAAVRLVRLAVRLAAAAVGRLAAWQRFSSGSGSGSGVSGSLSYSFPRQYNTPGGSGRLH